MQNGRTLPGALERNLRIAVYLAYRELRAESERTYIGFLWWILEPLASLLVYYVVFGLVLTRNIDNYVAFLFVGLVPWRWLQMSVMHGASSILSAKALMRQVHLPKIVFPAVTLLTDTFKFAVIFVIVVLFVLVSGFPVTAAYLWLPVLLVVQGLVISSATLLVAAVTPFFPDLRIVLDNVVRLWFFLSGIFYEVAAFPDHVQIWFRLNPMVPILEGYRQVLLEGAPPDPTLIGVIGFGGAALTVLAGHLILRYDYRYPKLAI
jgi:lipopolysaccharide transport system permease protein